MANLIYVVRASDINPAEYDCLKRALDATLILSDKIDLSIIDTDARIVYHIKDGEVYIKSAAVNA